MATVKRDTTIVAKTVNETVPVVRLTLSVPEAEALHTILRAVGGDRKFGREHADSILYALSDAGLRNTKYRVQGAAYFENPKTTGLDSLISASNPFTSARVF